MPKQRIGFIGRRLVGALAAVFGCAVAAGAYQNGYNLAGPAALLAVVFVSFSHGGMRDNGFFHVLVALLAALFAFGGLYHEGPLVPKLTAVLLLALSFVLVARHPGQDKPFPLYLTLDAAIGACVAIGLGALIFLATDQAVIGLIATVVGAFSWRTTWTVPCLDADATRRLVERMAAETWKSHPGFLLSVVRRDQQGTPAPVGFHITSRPTTVEVQGYADCVRVFQTPFKLPVVFAQDAYQRRSYEDMSDYISSRLVVVDTGSLQDLDTTTPLWSLPTSAHGRMAFEAQVAQA
jgi:hypothetical protein